MLYREPKVLKQLLQHMYRTAEYVSVLYREPKVLKRVVLPTTAGSTAVSVLYREPKVLKRKADQALIERIRCFSALP